MTAEDRVEKRKAERWADWLTAGRDPRDSDISPLYADFEAFPPLYIQAGSAEILIDMIKAYADKATREHMNHDFQAYGGRIEESREALLRISQFVSGVLTP